MNQANRLENVRIGMSKQTHLSSSEYSQLGRRLSIKQWSEASQGTPGPNKAQSDPYLMSKPADPYQQRLSSTQQFPRAIKFTNQYSDEPSIRIQSGQAGNRQFQPS